MIKSDIEKAIVGALAEIQAISGRELAEIEGTTRPIGDLPGFDSLNGVEATIEIGVRLGFEVPPDVNLFIEKNRHVAATVNDIVDRVCDLVAK